MGIATKKMNIRGHYSKFERKKFPFVYLLIAFPVLQFCVFWLGVNLSSICYAFESPWGTFTLDNFRDVFKAFSSVGPYNIHLGEALGRSFTLWVISNLITFPISIVTTYILYRKIWGHYFFRICYIIPGLMGSVIWVMIIRYMMQYNGPITLFVESLGIDLPIAALRNGLLGSEATAFISLILLNFFMGFVGNNVVLTGAFSRVPEELYESAELDGAGFWTVCFKIAIPCVWSTITMMMTFSLCSIFTADMNVFLYTDGTGEPGLSTIGFTLYKITYEISVNGSPDVSAYGYPAALGLVLTIMTLPIVLFGRRFLEKLSDSVEV